VAKKRQITTKRSLAPGVRLLASSEGAQRSAGRALHRDVAAGLSAAILELGLLQREAPEALAQAAPPALERALGALQSSAAALRAVELSLRPPLLDEAGLGPPLRWLADDEGVTLTLPASLPRLRPALEWQLFQALAALLRRGLRGLRRLDVTGPPLVLRLYGRPTPALPATVAEARTRLAGQATVKTGPLIQIRLRATE